MTSSSYGHLKLSGQNGQKDIVIMALSKVIRVQEGFAEPQSGSPATKRPEWAEKRLVKSTPKIARSPLSGHRTAVTSVTNHFIFMKWPWVKLIGLKRGFLNHKVTPRPQIRPELEKKTPSRNHLQNSTFSSVRGSDNCYIGNQPLFFH